MRVCGLGSDSYSFHKKMYQLISAIVILAGAAMLAYGAVVLSQRNFYTRTLAIRFLLVGGGVMLTGGTVAGIGIYEFHYQNSTRQVLVPYMPTVSPSDYEAPPPYDAATRDRDR